MGSNDFQNAQIRLIFKSLEGNKSLSILSANRKGLFDADVEELCTSLQKNEFLEKIELEYNKITAHGLKKIHDLLLCNCKLKHLSLEGNNLFSENEEFGIKSLCDSLKVNQTLIFLNLANTNLNSQCGTFILDMLQTNKALIMIHLHGNDISHEIMKEIQDLLIENRKLYENERTEEMIERENLRDELFGLEKQIDVIGLKNEEIEKIKQKVYLKQESNENLFFEENDKEGEFEMRLTRKLEKEAINRLQRKKKRPANPKN